MTDYRIRCGKTDARMIKYCLVCGALLLREHSKYKVCAANRFHLLVTLDDCDDYPITFV